MKERVSRILRSSFPLVTLVSVAPFVDLYARNLGNDVPSRDLVVYAVASAVSWNFFAAVAGSFWNPSRAAAAVSVCALMVFQYGAVASWLDGAGDGVVTGVWLIITAAGVAMSWLLGVSAIFRRFLLVFAAVVLLPPTWQILAFPALPRGPAQPGEIAFPLDESIVGRGSPVRTPNIYWIVVDSYPNGSALRRLYGFDDREFTASLQERGFRVAPGSHASYGNTLLSVTSTFDMDYPFQEGQRFSIVDGGIHVAQPGTTNTSLFDAIGGDNRAVAFLRQLGYRYIHLEDGTFGVTRCRGYEDVCIEARSARATDLENALLSRIPPPLAKLVVRLLGLGRVGTAGTPPASGTGIPEFAAQLPGLLADDAFFVYGHLFTPHFPFETDERCRRYEPPARRASSANFVKQVRCVGQQLLELADQITRDDSKGIVVFISDHGARLTVQGDYRLEDLGPDAIADQLGILNAVRIPAECAGSFSSEITPINLMRVILACVGGIEPSLVRPRYFVVAPTTLHDQYGEVREVEAPPY